MNTHVRYKKITPEDLGQVLDTSKMTVNVEHLVEEYFILFKDCIVEVFLGELDGQYYLVSKALAEQFYSYLKAHNFCNATLYGGMTREGELFFFPLMTSLPNEIYNWRMAAIEHALDYQWVNIDESDNSFTADAIDPSDAPFPDLTPIQMLNIAFKGEQFVNDIHHPCFSELGINSGVSLDIESLG